MDKATNPTRNIIFVHVPKAAGSTLRTILHRQYEEEKIHHISVNPSIRESIQQFRMLSPSERKRIRCLYGHGTYGLHEELWGETEYITMLRDPVERVISHYYYVLRTPDHRLHDTVTSQQMSLREYVESGVNPELENGMIRTIMHTSPNQKFLKKTKNEFRNRFGVVGTVEKFDESIILMKQRYGWKDIGYQVRNETRNRPSKQEIPKAVRRLIESKNRLDLRLYEFAQSGLEKALDGIERLDTERRRLQLQCQIRTAYGMVRETLGKWSKKVFSLLRY